MSCHSNGAEETVAYYKQLNFELKLLYQNNAPASAWHMCNLLSNFELNVVWFYIFKFTFGMGQTDGRTEYNA